LKTHRVDSDRHVTTVLSDNRGVQSPETGPEFREPLGKELPGEEEGNGQETTDGEGDGNEDVNFTSSEPIAQVSASVCTACLSKPRRDSHLGSKSTPSNGVTVVRLGVLTGPNTVSGNSQENLPLLRQD